MRIDPHATARRWSAVALIVAAACTGDGSTSPVATAPLRVSANVSGPPISLLVVTVTANDLREPMVFNITAANGNASGTLDVPPGHARTITAQGYAVGGAISHEGSVVINVAKGANPPVPITLRPKTGQVTVTLTVGSVGLTVSPAAFQMVAGGLTPMTLTSSLTDHTGATIPGAQVLWATSNPGIATVSSTGVVRPHATGVAQIVATYGGVSASSTVSVASGSVVVFHRALRDDGIYAVDVDGTYEGIVPNSVWADVMPAWSPDHRRISLSSTRDWGLVVLDADGANRSIVPNTEGIDTNLGWTPDGNRILFQRFNLLWTVEPSGANRRQLTFGNRNDVTASFSPDGQRIAVETYLNDRPHIQLLNGDGSGTPVTLTPGASPAWSPDGSLIAFSLNGEIFTVRPDGTDHFPRTDTGGNITPVWSPDGKRLAFAHGAADGQRIWVMNRDGSGARAVSSGPLDFNPSWR